MKQERGCALDDFMERIKRNNEYYDLFSHVVEQRTQTRDYGKWIETFCRNIPTGGRILDIGCGTGVHMSMFLARGFDVIGVEPSPGMRQVAASRGILVVDGAFEMLDQLDLPKVNAIWCAASLLHVPASRLTDVLLVLRSLLLSEGVLYITVRLGEGSKWDNFDGSNDAVARFIQLYDESLLIAALLESGYQVVTKEIEASYWGRPSRWINLLARVAWRGHAEVSGESPI